MLDLYRIIRERRIDLGMSQDELAKLTGYTSRSTIARIEKGEIDLPQSKIMEFAKALKVTPAYLMGWEDINGNEIKDEDTEVIDLKQKLFERPELRMLFDAADNATAEDIEMVAKMLEKMTNRQV